MAIPLNHLQTPIYNHEKQPKLTLFRNSRRLASGRRLNAVSGSGQQLIQSGVVCPILPENAASAMQSEGFILLDIRPEWETEKARVAGSLNVPLFIKDEDNSVITLLKKWVHFGYIGLWTGQNFTMINPEFLQQVEKEIPDKERKVLVACGEGLRSIMAVSKLHLGGYKNLGWLAGGFNRAADTDFPAVEGTEKLQYATIGGASYFFLKLLILFQAVGKKS
ncbi:hypothetical protein LIER_27769 [Lithospermum erythrorhizon]|uniref:Rhodanese domain-containing protein n=1 Tax=Lithospermum erythrorhizon TaxID=34254 RepID=A0AAV3RGW5_LITER